MSTLRLANETEYGLTGAVYSKNPEKIEAAPAVLHCRQPVPEPGCTGAMVGAHPFGGFNMSGTDSKAGGPDYLLLFTQGKTVTERTRLQPDGRGIGM